VVEYVASSHSKYVKNCVVTLVRISSGSLSLSLRRDMCKMKMKMMVMVMG